MHPSRVEVFRCLERFKHCLGLLILTIKITGVDGVPASHVIAQATCSELIGSIGAAEFAQLHLLSNGSHLSMPREDSWSASNTYTTELDLFIGVEDAHFDHLIVARA